MGRYHIFNYSDKDIKFCPKNGYFSNYRNFLLKEFFDSSNEEMDTIMLTYRNRFGDSAYQHVMRDYYSNWRNGDKTFTNIQKDRILSIMPALLNKNAINLIDEKKVAINNMYVIVCHIIIFMPHCFCL